MQIEPLKLPEVLLVKPRVFPDERGFFLETCSEKRYAAAGIRGPFPQDNHSFSRRGVLRGLHYQLRQPQGKLVFVVKGEIFDVAVDIRRGSPTFGSWVGGILSETNHHQLYIPPGFAHGFCVLGESADVMYKCTDYYDAGDDCGVLWSDDRLAIDWPVTAPVVSAKDQALPRLAAIPPERLPSWTPPLPAR